ncbi:MAG: acetoacetyl-CoA reductase [Parvibaculaceae bacterium]|nr:acetoacetyl-CoA reductase [Parvibaculaceae bacterium]
MSDKQRIAIVTGGTRGIGAAISVALKGAGYKVAANYAGNDEAANAFSKKHDIPVFKWDVGDYDACVQGIAAVQQQLGPVDTIVNNAGITRDAMLHKLTPQAWRDVIRVDLDSMFNMCQPLILQMREAGFGRIINISSINGQKGQMGQTNYSAAKAGVIGFTKALAQEVAKKGVTVNVICPGYIDTDMVAAVPEKVLEGIIAGIPVGRLGSAGEMAHAVLFLADENASFITGSTLTANGAQFIAG